MNIKGRLHKGRQLQLFFRYVHKVDALNKLVFELF